MAARSALKASHKPTTVAERRNALRAAKGEAVSGPGIRKVEIDLTTPSARKALAALHPRPVNEVMIEATAELESAALQYIEARDAATLATEKKEIAGNVLCNAIAKNLGVTGVGWKAEWDMTKGSVDWTSVAKELGIADDVIAKHRRPESRTLTVREIAEEG